MKGSTRERCCGDKPETKYSILLSLEFSLFQGGQGHWWIDMIFWMSMHHVFPIHDWIHYCDSLDECLRLSMFSQAKHPTHHNTAQEYGTRINSKSTSGSENLLFLYRLISQKFIRYYCQLYKILCITPCFVGCT